MDGPSQWKTALPDSNVGWANVGPTSGRQYRRWANVGPFYIVVWAAFVTTPLIGKDMAKTQKK